MSTILNKLKELVTYYTVNRNVGHTTRMLMGATTAKYDDGNYDVHSPAYILTHDQNMADYIQSKLNYYMGFRKNIKAIPFTSNNYNSILRGHRKPILIDNALLQQLLQESAQEIEYLEQEYGAVKNDTVTLNHFNKTLEGKVKKLEEENKRIISDNIKLETDKKELCETVVKLKCELIDYQEDDVNSENVVTPNCPPNVAEVIIGTFEGPFKQIKSIDLKIEYKE